MSGPVYPFRDRRWDYQAFNCGPFYHGYLATMPNGERAVAWADIGIEDRVAGRGYDRWQTAYLKMLGFARQPDGAWGLRRPEFIDIDPQEEAARLAQLANRRAWLIRRKDSASPPRRSPPAA